MLDRHHWVSSTNGIKRWFDWQVFGLLFGTFHEIINLAASPFYSKEHEPLHIHVEGIGGIDMILSVALKYKDDKVLDAVGDDELSNDVITVAQEQIQKR